MKCVAQSDLTKVKDLSVVNRLTKRLQNMLRGFCSRLLALKSSDRDKEENLEQTKNMSLLLSSKSILDLPGVMSSEEVALRGGQGISSRPMMALSPQITQLHFDCTTKEVMSTIVTFYKTEVPEEELTCSAEETSSDTSLLATSFVDNAMAWLEDISAASSKTSSSESLCVAPKAVICESSVETFQAQAAKRRSESRTCQVSQPDFDIRQDFSPTSSMSMDLQPTDFVLLQGTSSSSATSTKIWQSGVAISE